MKLKKGDLPTNEQKIFIKFRLATGEKNVYNIVNKLLFPTKFMTKMGNRARPYTLTKTFCNPHVNEDIESEKIT